MRMRGDEVVQWTTGPSRRRRKASWREGKRNEEERKMAKSGKEEEGKENKRVLRLEA